MHQTDANHTQHLKRILSDLTHISLILWEIKTIAASKIFNIIKMLQ